MKKMSFVLVLVALLMMIAIPIASAGMDYEDPALCVNGQWLMVDSALPSGIHVIVPDDAHYGNQAAGHCAKPAPATGVITQIREGALDHVMTVWVDGSVASTPTITVSYGNAVQTRPNTHRLMLFVFFAR